MAHTVCIILKANQTFSPIFAHYSHLILLLIPRSCLISIFLDCVCFLISKCNFSRANKANTNTSTNTMHVHRSTSTAVHMFSLLHSITCADNIIVIVIYSSSTYCSILHHLQSETEDHHHPFGVNRAGTHSPIQTCSCHT